MQTIDKVFVEPDDEIIFIVEKILQVATARVILVIPASSNVVSSAISLKLLSRQLLNSEKLLVLVTDNPVGKKLANKASIVVRDKISRVDKLAWDEALSIKKELQEYKDNIKKELLETRVPEKLTEKEAFQSFSQVQHEEKSILNNIEEIAQEVDSNKDIAVQEVFSEKPRLKPRLIEVGGIPIVSGGDINELLDESSDQGTYAEQEEISDEQERVVERDIQNSQKNDEGSQIFNRRLNKENDIHKKKRLKKLFIVMGITLVALSLLIGGAFAYSYLQMSKVEINVSFKQIEGNVSETITVSTLAREVDGDNLVIPGYEFSEEEATSGDGKASGTKEVGEFSRGVIDIRNKSTESAINLSTGQIIVDISTNLQYELTQNVAIPIDQYQRDVPIKAKEFGKKYNIIDQQSTFKFEGFTTEQVIGFGFRDITGGTNEEISIVSEEDISKLKADLETAIKGNLKTALQSSIGKGEKLLEGSERFEEISFTQSIPPGEKGENFSIDLKMKVVAIKLREKDLESLSELIIKKSEKATDHAKVKIGDFKIGNTKVDGSKITFELSANGELNQNLDLNTIKSKISGMTLTEAKNYLEGLEEVEKATVKYSPNFIPESLRKVPKDENRIIFD